MRYIKLFALTVALLMLFIRPAGADVRSQTNISAIVGDFNLNLDGFAFPYANIAVSSNNINIASTFVGKTGKFSILNIPVMKGFSRLCMLATDIKMVNRSKACFNIEPVVANTSVGDLFIPPTLSAKNQQITEGETINIYGYTMPGALVSARFNGGNYEITAGNTGLYKYNLKALKAGEYVISVDAEYAGKKSGSSKLNVKVLTPFEGLISSLKKLMNFYSILFVAVFIIISAIILISEVMFKNPFTLERLIVLKLLRRKN